jgi:hypothetical protein
LMERKQPAADVAVDCFQIAAGHALRPGCIHASGPDSSSLR